MEDDIFEANLKEVLHQFIHKFCIIIFTGVLCAIPDLSWGKCVNAPVYVSI